MVLRDSVERIRPPTSCPVPIAPAQRPVPAGAQKPISYVQPSTFDILAGATPAASVNGWFRMSAGRTLAAIPRSTIQTSTRLGMGIVLIKQDKRLVREDREFVVRQRAVTGQWSEAENLVADPGLLGRFELPELVHQFRGYRSHARKLISAPLPPSGFSNRSVNVSGFSRWTLPPCQAARNLKASRGQPQIRSIKGQLMRMILLKTPLFWKIEMNAWGSRKNLRSQMTYRRL